jgi:hypothetical protein
LLFTDKVRPPRSTATSAPHAAKPTGRTAAPKRGRTTQESRSEASNGSPGSARSNGRSTCHVSPTVSAPSDDPPPQVSFAAGQQQRVELGKARDHRDRDEIIAPEAPDLALDAALLVRARDARRAVRRLRDGGGAR